MFKLEWKAKTTLGSHLHGNAGHLKSWFLLVNLLPVQFFSKALHTLQEVSTEEIQQGEVRSITKKDYL